MVAGCTHNILKAGAVAWKPHSSVFRRNAGMRTPPAIRFEKLLLARFCTG
jgi:hypothetical protein